MQYNIVINQKKAIEWQLSLTEAIIFSYLYELPSWSDPRSTKDKLWYFCSKQNLLKNLPLITDKKDTIYRVLKSLKAKGIIDYEFDFTTNRDWIHITKKGRTYKEWDDLSTDVKSENTKETIGKKSKRGSEKNPRTLGKKSEGGSEKNPIEQYTSIYPITSNNTADLKFLDEFPFKSENFKKAWAEWLAYRKERRLSTYKPIGFKSFKKNFLEMAAGDEQTAVSLIENAIAKGWQGIYPIKNNFNGKSTDKFDGIGRTFKSDPI